MPLFFLPSMANDWLGNLRLLHSLSVIQVKTQEEFITEEFPSECKNVVDSDTDTYILKMLDVVYDDFDVFKLTTCCSESTKYANYVDSLTKISINNTYRLMDHLHNSGILVNNVSHHL